jgi:hypothetical protein
MAHDDRTDGAKEHHHHLLARAIAGAEPDGDVWTTRARPGSRTASLNPMRTSSMPDAPPGTGSSDRSRDRGRSSSQRFRIEPAGMVTAVPFAIGGHEPPALGELPERAKLGGRRRVLTPSCAGLHSRLSGNAHVGIAEATAEHRQQNQQGTAHEYFRHCHRHLPRRSWACDRTFSNRG